jgi:uroporphyrin-III C-methyltransferase/precorrin-2 dehydrogenase/sirohydrochlorin ferrochelatase
VQTLPVFIDIKGKPCLLVGDGELALRKCRLLDKAGAAVVTLSGDFTEDKLDGVVLVVVASADKHVNELISRAAKSRNIPVNVVDQPDLCTFIFPSIVERGPITVAVSSGGTVPVLARLLRARIETLLPASLGEFAQRVGIFRQQVSQRLPDMQQRLRFWDQLLQSQLIGACGDMGMLANETVFDRELDQFLDSSAVGMVSVVGAGPGNPDLLTFKALRCLQACDVVFFDSDVSLDIVNLARRDARQIMLENKQDIAELLQAEVGSASYVVYLKAGDPLSYREVPLLLARLQAADIKYEVVPGIIDQAGASIYAT